MSSRDEMYIKYNEMCHQYNTKPFILTVVALFPARIEIYTRRLFRDLETRKASFCHEETETCDEPTLCDVKIIGFTPALLSLI
jgi:hypothetical protein